MYHRSDWPEAGLTSAWEEGDWARALSRPADADGWARETRVGDLVVRWSANRNTFESQLYRFGMWELRVEADGARAATPRSAALDALREHLASEIGGVLESLPGQVDYLYSKVVGAEPLQRALSGLGFREVEHRRLYRTTVSELAPATRPDAAGGIRYGTLADAPGQVQARQREEILDLCREAFGQQGHSRHYTDPALLARLPGLAYTLAVMQLNFDRLAPSDFLVAVDSGRGRVCGFSVLEEKAGLPGKVYTQLLSAVGRDHRGRGIYQGLTELLRRRLPADAQLLNVTHAENRSMQNAYRQSGRVHLADTTIMRRVCRRDELP